MRRLAFATGVVTMVCGAWTLAACSAADEVNSGFDSKSDAQSDVVAPDVEAGTADTQTDASLPDARAPFDAAPPEVVCAVTPCIRSLVAGPRDYCAIATDGVVRCWGDPTPLGGFVDSQDPSAGATPVVLAGLEQVLDIGIGNYNMCLTKGDGSVVCLGADFVTPTVVPDVANASKLAIGDDRKCAVLDSGKLACWGDSWSVGSGNVELALDGESAVAATVKSSVAFALGAKGTLFSWGSEPYLLGRGTAMSPDLTPGPVAELPPVLQFAASDEHVCALVEDGRLYCWGRAYNGALGLGYVHDESRPVEVVFSGGGWPAQIAAATTHSCARMTDGSLMCWASINWYGELGYASPNGVYMPTRVGSLTKPVISVALGTGSTCALLLDGSVQCWGDNSAGQLGQLVRDGSRHPVPTPVIFQ